MYANTKSLSISLVALFAFTSLVVHAAELGEQARPIMRDFVGLNGHYHFKPALYYPVARKIRTYHDMNWDVTAPGDPPTFPRCVNGVDWTQVYGPWNEAGIDISLCVQFVKFGRQHPDHRTLWKGHTGWAREYGRAMARFFGPTHGNAYASSIEIGNEPGNEFDDLVYREIFRNMAEGIREGDPALRILTCAAQAAPADKYMKSLTETFLHSELLPLFDGISVHTYAFLPENIRAHPWERTYPEDPRSPFLKSVDDVIAWRDHHAPSKEIWVTEFGWDACSEEAMSRREGWAEKLNWSGVDELDQARYLVRSILLFAKRDIRRVNIYFYNDQDQPSVHASSGITRNFKPKLSYWALAQFQEILGDYRFDCVVVEKEGLHLYAFKKAGAPAIHVLWNSSPNPILLNPNTLLGSNRYQTHTSMATTSAKPLPKPVDAPIEVTGDVIYLSL